MSVIQEIRKERGDLARVLKKHAGIRKIVEELYPDSAHFIYELLQNAEDAKDEYGKGATEAQFVLSNEKLIFEHNGRAFNKRDIEAITDIGEGTKVDDNDKIGRFGVGFKSVFAYSETPHIWSPTFSFKIEDLVLPYALDPKCEIGDKTCFEFPFDSSKKSPEDAYTEIKSGLNELAETTLLFLTHLESIQWKVGKQTGEILRVQHSENHFEVLKQIDGKTTTSSHFLKFSQQVRGLENQYVSIAYALEYLPNIRFFNSNKPLAKLLKIAPATLGRVAVFFPAEKETSGLRFHLHAPFVPELSRASVKDTPVNEPLFDQLAELAASSLHDIRDLGLLTRNFLEVLPNTEDPIPDRYECIHSSIVEAMNTKPLTPTHLNSHEPAQDLLQAKASLKNLISEDDLEFLVEYEGTSYQWSIGAKEYSAIDKFLKGLDIREWGLEKFNELLSDKTIDNHYTDIDDEFTEWMAKKPVEWHQQLYALLYDEAEDALYNRLKNAKIIRLNDGGYSTGDQCFFPGDAFENDGVLLRIDGDIFTSGKNKKQKKSARKFLEEIGVRKVGEAEQIEATLKKRYKRKIVNVPNELEYWKDLKRFMQFVENEPNKAHIFRNYYIFECEGQGPCKASDVFLDSPFLETGLSAYFDAIGEDTDRFPLTTKYLDSNLFLEKFAKFAEATGAQTRLEVEEQSVFSHPNRNDLRKDNTYGVRRTHTEIDEDWYIQDLENIFNNQSVELSKLVWSTLRSAFQEIGPEILSARYRPNQQYTTRTAPSSLCLELRQLAWIPQKEGKFVRPADASSDELPEGFPFETGVLWLKEIGFGTNEERQLEKHQEKESIAQKAGFEDVESMERAKRFTSLPFDEQERFFAELEHKKNLELPEKESSNPERRAQRVGEQAVSAPKRQTEKRTRSVSTARDGVKEEAKQYLQQQYTNSDGEMICQICKNTLPFKFNDGAYYFETTEFLSELGNHYYQNYLALCPNHRAMFKYVNGTPELMQDMLEELEGKELDIDLAQHDETIYFTQTHIADLKSIIDSEKTKQSPSQQNQSDSPCPPSPFSVGDKVKILEGPFLNFSGLVQAVNNNKKTLTVNASLFGRETPIELEYTQIEKTS